MHRYLYNEYLYTIIFLLLIMIVIFLLTFVPIYVLVFLQVPQKLNNTIELQADID